jgi:hypothetical protein
MINLNKMYDRAIESARNAGRLTAIAYLKIANKLKRIGRYTPKEGDRVICLYQGNNVYGLEATVVTVAYPCDRVYIKFGDGKIIPFSFDDVMLRDRHITTKEQKQ